MKIAAKEGVADSASEARGARLRSIFRKQNIIEPIPTC
jgi:hypothetical protein